MSTPRFIPDPTTFTRHCILVGQSGSGKTGFLIAILEALALAGVPIVAIDLKNDLCNLSLVLPNLAAADFLPLLDADEARRHGTTPEALAEKLAASWRAGLAADGVLDLSDWHDRVDVQILTPGADLAPVDVLSALTAPPAGLQPVQLRDWITGAVSSLLSLIDVPSDPFNDPPAILLAQLYTLAFEAGQPLPFDALLPQLLRPPFERLGLFPMDEAFPPKARQSLALKLNNVLAAPAFAPWRHGAPLDVEAWFRPSADGRVPIRVLSLAHLDDAGRVFFVTLVLHAIVAWMRRQPGTSALRAVLAFDESFGFLPPQPHNPPTKPPILTLIKQGRAFGLGVILATQNPKDLDHRVISNAATWLVARLLTEHDRDRVIEGMGGDPKTLHAQIAALPDRRFLHRAPDGRLQLVRSPHTRAWLAGPMTPHALARVIGSPRPTIHRITRFDRTPGPPPLPHDLRCAWLSTPPAALTPHLADLPDDAPTWIPAVYARIQARIRDDGDEVERVRHRLWLTPGNPPVSVRLPDEALSPDPQPGEHALLPPTVDTPAELDGLQRQVLTDLARQLTVTRYVGPGVSGRLGEPEADVAARHPGVPLAPTLHHPAARDLTVAWFGVVWLRNPRSPA